MGGSLRRNAADLSRPRILIFAALTQLPGIMTCKDDVHFKNNAYIPLTCTESAENNRLVRFN